MKSKTIGKEKKLRFGSGYGEKRLSKRKVILQRV
jgi:hypothetical protein